MPHRRNQPTDYRIISRGVELLRSGALTGELPGRLRDEFGISPERAGELAGKAVELSRKQSKRGKLGTRPFDKPG